MRGIAAVNFRTSKRGVVGLQVLHQPLHALLQRPRDTHTRHMRHRAQQASRAPAANHHVASFRLREHLFGGIDGQAVGVGGEALHQAGLAFAQTADQALRNMHLVGHMLEHFMAQVIELHVGSELLRNVPCE